MTEPAVIYHFKNKVGLLIAVLEHRDREDMATFAHSLGVEPEDMWSGNAQFGSRRRKRPPLYDAEDDEPRASPSPLVGNLLNVKV